MYTHQDKALNEHLRNFAIYDCIQYYFHCKHEVAALLAVENEQENEHNVKVPFSDLISEHLKQMIAHKSPVLNPLNLIGNMKFTKKVMIRHWNLMITGRLVVVGILMIRCVNMNIFGR